MGICISSASSNDKIHETEFANSPNGLTFQEQEDKAPCETIIHKHGSVCSKQGSKGPNQDSAILSQDYGMKDETFCGVFDGHGQNGHIVSNIVKSRLPSLLLSQKNVLQKLEMTLDDHSDSQDNKNFNIWKEAIVSGFKVMDKEIKLQENLDCSCSGTTAAVVVRQGEDLIIANLGDSRAILGRITEEGIEAIQLTTDLKPGLPSEADRIKRCNGRVLALKEEPHIQRVWLPNEDYPGLAMSRAFGDFALKNHGVIAVPDISYCRLSPHDHFIVLATDGVWDVLSNNEVASIVWAACQSDQAAAKAVVEAASVAWGNKFPSSKVDDCTAVCLFMQQGNVK